MAMTPFEVAVSIIPSLKEKEKIEIRKLVGSGPSPCDKNGHKLKLMKEVPKSFFSKAYTLLFCEKCGLKITMDHCHAKEQKKQIESLEALQEV